MNGFRGAQLSHSRFGNQSGQKSVFRLRCCLALLLFACGLSGCRTVSPDKVGLPTRHSLKSEQLLVLSDFKLPSEHPIIQDLVKLRKQVSELLQLPVQTEKVVVYLFSNELDYHKYIQTAHPGLPSRRAYFIATPQELAVYTFWGERIQEDLRHEYTHGLLHACLNHVPLWLDEGLAEYFEVAGATPGRVNPDYARHLTQAMGNGWKPDMERLERLEKVDQMQRADYREAWAWVHFMLHSSPDTKQVLLTYLQKLRDNSDPPVMSKQLAEEVPELQNRFQSYISSLNTFGAGTKTG